MVQNGQAAQALDFYLEAARKGSAVAYYDIGTLYESGQGVNKTLQGALDYYKRAVALGYLQAYSRMIIVQGMNKTFNEAARTFFAFYRANPDLALQSHKDWSGDILRTIQVVMKNSGHYKGAVDGRFGPETRAAIAAYASGKQASAPVSQTTRPAAPVMPEPEKAGDPLARKLQRQLRRVGCYDGPLDGDWGRGSARALRNFNHWAGNELPTGYPTPRALRAVRSERGEICGFD